MAMDEAIYLDEPTEQVNVKDLPFMDVPDCAIVRFTIANNTLGEGKTVKELAGGKHGFVKFLSVNGEAFDTKTGESKGRLNLKLFLNTKVHFMASNFAACVGAYDPVTKRSQLIPEAKQTNAGETFYTVPAINGKSLIVGVVRGEDYMKSDGTTIPQYDLAGVLSEQMTSARHYINGICNPEVVKNDKNALFSAVNKQLEYQKQRKQQIASQAYAANGAGAAVYGAGVQAVTTGGTSTVPNGDEIPF